MNSENSMDTKLISVKKSKKTEILAPGGSFEKGVYAFEGGADAVYIGLENFSARHFSANFGFSELEKLKKIATEQNKKIYITLNTVIKEDEIAEVIKFLIEIEIIGVDGAIIQDFGVLHLLTNYFPTLDIHASTQMAIHNSTGVKLAKKLGFSRIVLARELSFEEIHKIRKDNPDIELEVFIHGSLCYSFSGCCLVSGLTVSSDRSANRGKCSQVCRTWFEKSGKNSQNGYYFSLKDLSLDEKIKKLVDIGIDSLKIEGRMKNSVYTKFSSKYYRSLLDNSHSNELNNNKEQLKFGFSRKETSFFIDPLSTSSLTDSNYAGHYGNKIGYISRVSTKKNNIGFYVKFNKDKDVSKRDGVLFFDKKSGKPINVSVDSHFEKNGFIRSLAKVDIGDPIYLTSKSNLNLKIIEAKSFKGAKKKVILNVNLKKKTNNLITLSFSYKLETVNSCSGESLFEIEFENAKSSTKNLKSVFEESLNKNLYYFFKLNFLSGENENIFIRLSDLKGIKKRLVVDVDDTIVKYKEDKFDIVKSKLDQNRIVILKRDDEEYKNEILHFAKNDSFESAITERMDLVFNSNLPFITEFDKENSFKQVKNIYFTSISPIQLDNDENKLFITQLSEYVNRNKDKKFCIGLNNISHLILLEKIVGTHCTFFLDFYIYTANVNTTLFFYNYDNRIKFAYYWIESDEYDKNKNILSEFNIYSIKNKKEVKPPLFYSRVCFAKETMGISCENCKKSFTFNISQNGKDKSVIVKDCITYVI